MLQDKDRIYDASSLEFVKANSKGIHSASKWIALESRRDSGNDRRGDA